MWRFFLVFLICLSQPLWAQVATPTPEPPPSAEVRVGDVVFFNVHYGLGSSALEQRARAIAKNIDRLAKDPLVEPGQLVVVEEDLGSAINYHGEVILLVTNRDAKAEGVRRVDLAAQWCSAIKSGIVRLREQRKDFDDAPTAVGKTIFGAFLLWLLVHLLFRLDRGLANIRTRWEATWLRLPARSRLYRFTLRLLRSVLTLLLTWTWLTAAFLYLAYALSLYARTIAWSYLMFSWLATPMLAARDAIIDYIPNVFYIMVIAILAHLGLSVLRLVFQEMADQTLSIPGFHPEWSEPTLNISRAIVMIFTLITIFPYLPGAKSQAFQGVSLVVGLLVSMSSSSILSNIFAGIVLIYTRAFRLGDRVEIGGCEGEVVESSLIHTCILTPHQVVVTIPNSSIMTNQIKNLSKEARKDGVAVVSSITIGYNVPWRQVHQLLIQAAIDTPGIKTEPRPFVLQTNLNDFHVGYQVLGFTEDSLRMHFLVTALNQNIQDRFAEANVEIMSPTYLALRDGNQVTTPDPPTGPPRTPESSRFKVEMVKEDPPKTEL